MPRVWIADSLSPAALAIFRQRGIEAGVKLRPGGFVLPHPPRDSRSFPTASGSAQFSVNELEVLQYLFGPNRTRIPERWAAVPTRTPAWLHATSIGRTSS